ncbi:helix-turn-helix domain-containing protein [Cupriavidus basilensis]|uniref:helix-turn-helix domain-containing protein n=1 Tax=Cupriavidus basilensis TaxID=68895 RepID=UPI00157AA4BD|nr:helix-turn-helix domain-containing protein [Cupriavidus basilensis]NUA27469.1 helix-turn-helix domain-containing protein [Cupriavidus basilensis]
MPVAYLLCYPSAAISVLSTAVDTLRIANTLASMQLGRRGRAVPFQWHVAASEPRRWQELAGVLQCDCVPLAELARADKNAMVVIAPPIFDHIAGLEHGLSLLDRERAAIANAAAKGALLVAPFTAVALLVALGLPAQRRLAVPWVFGTWMRQVEPARRLQADQAVVKSGNVFSSRALDHVHALLQQAVARTAGKALARTLGNTLLDQPARGEALDIWIKVGDAPRESVVLRARRHLQQHLAEPYDLGRLASVASTSERTLLRHFMKSVGMSPLQFLHRLRAERACHLLEVTTLSLTAIAEQCGYQDISAFRKLVHRHTGLPPGAHRRAHSVRAELRSG